MNCEVAVYHFRDPDDCDGFEGAEAAPFVIMSIKLDLVATVEIKDAGLSAKEVAARAWIEAVGRDRQSRLIELGAPTVMIEAQGDPLCQSDYIREAPGPLCQSGGFYQFVLDNLCESWLIQLSSDWSPDRRFSALAATQAARQGAHIPTAEPRGSCAALGTLWHPRLN